MNRYGQTMANTLQGINEKLKPSDGAGAYIKDFRKSDAPQFKGKSDKEIQKMAVAAYLDDKEENMNIGMNEKMMKGFVVRYTDKSGERLAIPYKTKDRAKEEVKALKKVGAKDIEITTHNLNFKEDNIQEDGHTDVASAIRQCKTMIEDATQIASKLQGMNPEESLPSWWTNKLAVSSNSMNKLRDYFLIPTTEETESAFEVSGQENEGREQLEEKAPDTADAMKRYKSGNAGFTDKAHLKAKGLIPRADGTKKVSDKYKEDVEEGFASDAQRRAAFAQGYKAKGKKGKKEEKTKFERYTGVPNPRTEGRKSNYAVDDDDEEGANKNIIMQLYKAISLRGRHDVVFDDGKKVKVKEPIAIRAVELHRQIQKPRERLAFQNKISKSYRDLLNAIR